MGEYVYRMDDDEKMADHLESARSFGSLALRFIRRHEKSGARMASRSAAHHARE